MSLPALRVGQKLLAGSLAPSGLSALPAAGLRVQDPTASGFLREYPRAHPFLPLQLRNMAAAAASKAVVFQSPSRYVQQPGAIKHIGEHVRATFPDLRKPAVLLPGLLRPRYLQDLQQSLTDPVTFDFDGECSLGNLQKLTQQLEGRGVDHVVGFGGGKLLDMTKLLAHKLGVQSIILPSLAATDAPCTALSVVYTDEGQFVEYEFFPKPPDMVIVDSEVIANAPVRFLVAGMGDAMATYYEARACYENPGASSLISPFTYRPSTAALAIAQKCLETLFAFGPQAKADCEARVVTEPLERVIEANILMSGVGAENGGLAIAHGLHNAMTQLPETHAFMHGEKVALGTLVQLVYEKDYEAALQVAKFNSQVGLPTSFKDLGVGLSETQLQLLVEGCMAKGETCWNEPGELTAEGLRQAIVEAEKVAAAAGPALKVDQEGHKKGIKAHA